MTGRAKLYLGLAIVGAVVPIAVIACWLGVYGFDLGLLWKEMTSTLPAKALLADLTISSIVFWVWMSGEAPKLGLKRWWPFVLANLIVGLCFALPLFLYQRERHLT